MDGETIDIRGMLNLLRRRFWLILFVTGLALALAGSSLLVLKPVYSATTLVLVDPSKKNLLDPDTPISGSSTDSLRVDSEVELVKSETTLLRVANALDLARDPEFGLQLGLRDTLLTVLRIAEPATPSPEDAMGTVLSRLRDAISVQRRGLTFLIAVTARSTRAEFAATLANAVAEGYIQEQLEAKVSSTMRSRDIIQARIADASATVTASENAFDNFVDKNLQRISEATGRSDLEDIRREIAGLSTLRAENAARAERAAASLATGDWQALARELQSSALASLEEQRDAIVQQLASATADSAEAIDLRASLASLDSELKQQGSAAVAGLKQSISEAQTRATELRGQLRTAVIQSDLPPDMVTSIYELQQSAEIARAQYQTLLTRQQELDTQAFLQVADSRVVSNATPPSSPSFPNPRLILTLAAIAGVGLGVGFAFLIENFVGGFTSEAQAASILRAPVLALVPRQRPPRSADGQMLSVADTLIQSPLSVYAEAIRRIRIGVDQAVHGQAQGQSPGSRQGVVVMTSSAAPGEGKTTLALSLGRAYALSGMSTLIIDADLRKPSLHKQLGMEPSGGLLDYLTGKDKELNAIMTVDDAPSGAQAVLGSRRGDVVTDQLVASKTFGRLIHAARQNFDVIILDTPPVGPVVDGLYLSRFADVVVFIVKWSDTPQQEVRSALATLVGAKPESVPVVTVLNQQVGNRAGYRGKYSGYYSDA